MWEPRFRRNVKENAKLDLCIYITIWVFLDSKLEDKWFLTEWHIFIFYGVVSKYLNFSTFSEDLLHVVLL
jgi:fluoride ion exporter CrcB/FEX